MNFGNPEAYYSQTPLHQLLIDEDPIKLRLIRLIEHTHPETKVRVEAAVKRWRPFITEKLKQETGLKYKHGKKTVPSVNLKVVTSVPPDLLNIFRNTDEILWEFLLKGQDFKTARALIDLMGKNSIQIVKLLNNDDHYFSGVGSATKILSEVIANLELKIGEKGLRNSLFKLGPDRLLGAYFYRQPLIEIYWPAIAVFSNQLGCGVEELTFVILAHEMAHFVTHKCFDLEGDFWKLESFASCDSLIVEGFAQFYTEILCNEVEQSYFNPHMKETFNLLLDCQAKEYTEFQSWLVDDSNRKEAMRLALLNSRKRNIVDYVKFEEVLKDSKNAFQ